MIVYFPTAYPDELLYSQLSRYYIKSGHIAYIFAAKELFERSTDRPDVEFLNRFSTTALPVITQNSSIEQIILKHTMFPYYGRFVSKERRRKAFYTMASMEAGYKNVLAIPKNKDGKQRYLRYCPLCVQADRQMYGEAYWHRIHQMTGINICPIHKCFLCNSAMAMDTKTSPIFFDADSNISNCLEIQYSDNELECSLAEYMAAVFRADIDMNSYVTIGKYLHYRMAGTKYLSHRGQHRNISVLHDDFVDYYKSLQDNWFTELWQIQKVMTNDRVNFYEICLLGMFLNILPDELTHPVLPKKSVAENYDERIFELHKKGLNYQQIADMLGGSYHTIKAIGEKRYGTYHKQPKKLLKFGAKPKDWNTVDKSMLPLVARTIAQLHGDKITRPRRVTVSTIERLLELPSKRIELLPRCKALVVENIESLNEYWARETIWAANKIITEGQPFNWTHLRMLTNMRPENLQACIPYLSKFGTADMVEKIKLITKEHSNHC